MEKDPSQRGATRRGKEYAKKEEDVMAQSQPSSKYNDTRRHKHVCECKGKEGGCARARSAAAIASVVGDIIEGCRDLEDGAGPVPVIVKVDEEEVGRAAPVGCGKEGAISTLFLKAWRLGGGGGKKMVQGEERKTRRRRKNTHRRIGRLSCRGWKCQRLHL